MEKNIFLTILIALALIGSAVSVRAGEDLTGVEFFAEADLNADGAPAVKIMVGTGERAINAVAVHLSFNPAVWQVAGIKLDDSFCSLWLESSFDNLAGRINLLCGRPNPGFSGLGLIGEIYFAAQPDVADFSLTFENDCQALANDGQGTNILDRTEDFIFPAGLNTAVNQLAD